MLGAAIAPVADAQLGAAIGAGDRLVAAATAQGLAFALDQLGDIDIPEPAMARIDKAQLRALATLYLAADLEPAGIIAAVETLSGLAATGASQLDLGGAEPLVASWWRRRNERLGAPERSAFFSRLFGTSAGPIAADAGRNAEFENCMLDLCEALYKLDELAGGSSHGGAAQQARVRAAARATVANLAEASGGITAFMAGEIIAALKEAFAILGDKDLRRAFAARDVWGVIGGVGRISRRSFRHPGAYVRRGKAGMTVIAWLAEVSGEAGGAGGAPLVAIGHPVIGSAIDWLQATLEIGEAAAPEPPAPPPRRAAAGAPSPWSALAH